MCITKKKSVNLFPFLRYTVQYEIYLTEQPPNVSATTTNNLETGGVQTAPAVSCQTWATI